MIGHSEQSLWHKGISGIRLALLDIHLELVRTETVVIEPLSQEQA